LNSEGSHLTQDAFCNIAWTLGTQANVQTELPAFSGDQLKRIEFRYGIFIAYLSAEKIVRFIDDDNHKLGLKITARAMLRSWRPITFATISRALNSYATPLRQIRSSLLLLATKSAIAAVNGGSAVWKMHSKADDVSTAFIRDIRDKQ